MDFSLFPPMSFSLLSLFISIGHRSPPLTHEQPQHQRPIERERKRERATRFGTPPPQSGVTANDPEEWVPDEFKDTGRIANTNRVEDPVADSERPSEPPSDPQQSSRRKRAPLPPQSARFREASRNKTPPPRDISLLPTQKQETGPPQPPFRPQLPSSTIMTRDPPPHQKVTKFGPIKADESIPIVSSSPRQHTRAEGTEGDRGLNQNDGSSNADHDGSSSAPPPKGPRAMGGRDDSSSTTSQRREFVPSPARTWKDEMFGSTRPGRGKNGRGRPPPPPAPPPHLSGGNNVPVAGRIGADGIPNGPARSIPAPAPKLSSANKIPVTNNRYAAESRQAHEEARSRSPPHSRNGGGHGIRMTSGPMTYERDEPPTRGREHAMPMASFA
ncbi:hypothetical protein GYMLUDRAFT_886782 [Collybiopsis luxurians FD-317 M1]|uniref:Uncharacterized protein n=1 Tax=Collybiopsis luxurians FD-317 M1 TaxID=944289 RepID=A0A0D0BJW7_9AGAR|nr:hypothetical protein GYMLUDRAFT_886782 [Collybiopsis luxurians FD-317 M1]